MTGLAAIFLMVMVAAAGMRPTPAVVPVDPPSETLAVLGVAPGVGTVAVDRPAAPPPAESPKRPSRP